MDSVHGSERRGGKIVKYMPEFETEKFCRVGTVFWEIWSKGQA